MELTPKVIARVLTAAADLLERKGWTKGEYAKAKDGQGCDALSRRAECYCVAGAIHRVARSLDYSRRRVIENAVERHLRLPAYSITDWNDSRRSAKTVIRALRSAAQAVLKAAA